VKIITSNVKKYLTLAVTLLFFSVSVISSTGTVIERSSIMSFDGNTLYVGGSGPGNYTTIQAAIDNASDGDNVFVYDDSSPYYENLLIKKSIKLIGENNETTIIDGNSIDDVIKIKANNVEISSFTIQNSKHEWIYAGIDLSSNKNTISENIIINNGCGILLSGCSKNEISHNVIESNLNGIRQFMGFPSYNVFSNNIFIDNGLSGLWLLQSRRNTISDNSTVENNIVSYNNCPENQGYGIAISWCSEHNTIQNNELLNNLIGIIIYGSSENIFSWNNIK